jgi:hypothetical protein
MEKTLITALLITVFASVISADTITLKDEQQFSADVKSFDKFFLVAKMADGQEISIPWKEVSSVSHTTTTESWLEETYMTAEPADVNTLVVPLSPGTAFFRALNPGILVHGSGHFYARDTNMGMSLLSAEIVSLIIMGISLAELATPVEQDQSYNVTKIVMYSGIVLFGGSWLYDLIFAGSAAERFNSENKFIMEGNSKDAGSPGK